MQVMTIAPVILIALLLLVSFVAWRVWLEHRRYDEFIRVLEKQPAQDPVRAIAGIQDVQAHRGVQQRAHAERAHAARRGTRVRSHRLRIVEN